jgi:hypothetical protein
MRKKLLVENELSELDDFQKILLLNKGKINYEDLEFTDSEGNDYSDIIEITKEGLIFHFEDLQEFLRFFFKDEYGVEGSESYYDASSYDSMYYNTYDYIDSCYYRYNDDWDEGYSLQSFCSESLGKIKELLTYISYKLASDIVFDGGKYTIKNDSYSEISRLLKRVLDKDIVDETSEIMCDAESFMKSKLIPEEIESTYCDSLSNVGIEKWSKYCFKTYFISWGRLVQMYVGGRGIFDEKLLDVMFHYINKKSGVRHLPTYYELENDVWDSGIIKEQSCDKLVDLIDGYIEEFNENGENYDLKVDYLKTLEKINKYNLFKPQEIPGQKNMFINVLSVEQKTNKVRYAIGDGYHMGNKVYGVLPVDEFIMVATQPGFFDPKSFRIDPKKWSEFRN